MHSDPGKKKRMKRQFLCANLHQLHWSRAAWLPLESRERVGEEALGGREPEESVYSKVLSSRVNTRILAVGKQGSRVTSRRVRVPEQDRFKKNFFFFIERGGSDGSLAFKFRRQRLERTEAVALCHHFRAAG